MRVPAHLRIVFVLLVVLTTALTGTGTAFASYESQPAPRSADTDAVVFLDVRPVEFKLPGLPAARGPGDGCTGVLINESWVLTAQHCTNKNAVQGRPHALRDYVVKFANGKQRHVVDVPRLDGYDSRTGANDIALLKLDKPMTDISPISFLDGVPAELRSEVDRYGYGHQKPGDRGDPDHPELRIMTEGLWSWAAATSGAIVSPCGSSAAWITSHFHEDTALLTRDIGRGESSNGDSGGPVVLGASWALAGITSGTQDLRGCQDLGDRVLGPDYLGISNRVDAQSAAFGWIQQSVGPVTLTQVSSVN